MFFSVIVPTFSRPDEVSELLTSLESQDNKNFEVILADGSLDDSVKAVAGQFKERLKLVHLHQKGLGISESRNWGVEYASGDWLVFFDSDCVIPPQYFTEVENSLNSNPLDVYGGPDNAAASFNNRQKAINYAMTSFFTTGGIRGKKQHIGHYQPRGFNMGIRKDAFLSVGGYSGLKVSEDIDLGIRLLKKGYKSGLFEKAYVYHKRRSTFYKFFRQVSSFGSGRIDLHLRHGDALKPVHLMPALFVLYLAGGILAGFFLKPVFLLWLASIMLYMTMVFLDATFRNRSPVVGLLSLYAAFIMLTGYGVGMLKAIVMRMILGSTKESEKPEITKEA